MHAGHPLYNLQLKLRKPILMAGDASRHSACLQCTQKCYRTHGNGNFNGSCFFKVMLNDFATRLRVPPKFVDQMNDLIGPDVILEGPSGQLWHAELCCMDSEVSIADGWERFVSDHAIEIGDFLVFKHAGKSHFIVQIFGRSGCEKQSHFKVTSFEKSCLQTENLCVISDLKMQENEMTHTPNFHQNDRVVDIRDKMIENVIEISDTNSCDVSVGYGKPVEKRHSSFRARKGKLDAAPSLETAKIDVPWPGSMKILQTGTADKRVKAWNCAQLSCNKKVQYIKSQRRGHKCCVSRRSMKRAGNQRVLKEALSFKTTKPICLITMSKSAVSNQCRLVSSLFLPHFHKQ